MLQASVVLAAYHMDGDGIVSARAVAPHAIGTEPLRFLGLVRRQPHLPGRVAQAAVVAVGVPGLGRKLHAAL